MPSAELISCHWLNCGRFFINLKCQEELGYILSHGINRGATAKIRGWVIRGDARATLASEKAVQLLWILSVSWTFARSCAGITGELPKRARVFERQRELKAAKRLWLGRVIFWEPPTSLQTLGAGLEAWIPIRFICNHSPEHKIRYERWITRVHEGAVTIGSTRCCSNSIVVTIRDYWTNLPCLSISCYCCAGLGAIVRLVQFEIKLP